MIKKYFLCSLLGLHFLLSQQFSHPLRAGGAPVVKSVAGSDTLRVLAILVQFQTDDDDRTTGNGTFDLAAPAEPIIDAAPHDSSYFADHFVFARNYFLKASNGRQKLQTTVLGSVITLPYKMEQYAPVDGNEPLAKMIEDSWIKADSIYPNFPFQNYDLFVVFHAGSGKDVDLRGSLGYDPNPLDIPSLYFNLASLRKIFGQSYAGIHLPNADMTIQNSVVLPETEVRKIPSIGADITLKLGMNGLIVASIASHLGLPDLFDTKTGKTAIGRFGLMDGQAIFSFMGICPPEPSAWEKSYLGWTTPIEVYGDTSLTVPAASLYDSGIDTMYKVPISAKEYFLVENRQRDAKLDSQTVWMKRNGQLISKTFSADEDFFSNTNIDSIYGVVVDVDELDWGIPGLVNDLNHYAGGIVIWHIDESIIDRNISANSINADPDHRGVDVDEADGSQDIGQSYDIINPGSGSEDGSPLDYWFAGNIAPVYTNEFSETSHPNSLSNAHARTNITMKNFSVSGPRMTFDVRVGSPSLQLAKIIKRSGPKLNNDDAPLSGDIDGNGTKEILFTSGDSIFVLKNDLTPFFTDPSGLFSSFGGKFQPVVYNSTIAGIPFQHGVISIKDSSIYLFQPADANADGNADIYTSINVGSRISTPVTVQENGTQVLCIVGTEKGEYVAAAAGGAVSVLTKFSSPVVSVSSQAVASTDSVKFGSRYFYVGAPVISAASLNSQTVVLTGSSIVIFDHVQQTHVRTIVLPAKATSGLALADVDKDNSGDLLVGIGNALYAYAVNGSVIDHFPFTLSTDDTIIGTPAVADNDIVFGTKNGLLYSINGRGEVKSGFPLQTGGMVSSPMISDTYIAVASSDSALYLWNQQNLFTSSHYSWQTYLGSPLHNTVVNFGGSHIQKSDEMLPKAYAYNWPNPVYGGTTNIRYFLGKAAVVTIKILNMAGELVDEVKGTSDVGFDNEVQWNVSNIQSGIYFAEISASGNAGDQKQIVKIAVVK